MSEEHVNSNTNLHLNIKSLVLKLFTLGRTTNFFYAFIYFCQRGLPAFVESIFEFQSSQVS